MKTFVILWAMACLLWTTVPTWAQGQPIKIGVQFIMTGKLGGDGQNAELAAVKMAMEEINSGGGILGRKILSLPLCG